MKTEDFLPMIPNEKICGCEKQGYLVNTDIRVTLQGNEYQTICHRQQCQECGFVRKNRMGKPFYFNFVSGSYANVLPEYFNVPDKYIYDNDGKYCKEMKIDFVRRILTLANKYSSRTGHLEFTEDEIYSLDI